MADKFLGFLGDLVKPTSGGGGNYVYYDLSNIPKESDAFWIISSYATATKVAGFGQCTILGGIHDSVTTKLACAVDVDFKCHFDGKWGSPKDLLDSEAEYYPELQNLPEITKEEFYEIPLVVTNELEDNANYVFKYDEGMTWAEWIDSPYNTKSFTHDGQYVLYGGNQIESWGDDIYKKAEIDDVIRQGGYFSYYIR